jgi:hypothetical protein
MGGERTSRNLCLKFHRRRGVTAIALLQRGSRFAPPILLLYSSCGFVSIGGWLCWICFSESLSPGQLYYLPLVDIDGNRLLANSVVELASGPRGKV